MMEVAMRPLETRLANVLSHGPGAGLEIHWLGQAGFVIDAAGCRLVIDPYLSDSLAEKYRGTIRPHVRMMPPPVEPSEIRDVDFVLCTHAHTDHMDPGTLPALMRANPRAKLIAPAAARDQALLRSGVDEKRIIFADAGGTISMASGLAVAPTRSAHETLDTDKAGHYLFLGYVIRSAAGTLWHSGDCAPFDGLVEEVAPLLPDIALLPVNGRSAELRGGGIAGNFFLAEAIDIADRIGASCLIAHHYGMFDFNTASPEAIDEMAGRRQPPTVLRARCDMCFSGVSGVCRSPDAGLV
jgi:L-ascorbate metabolism protein UlaG (beta-lactamase superfamily)